MWQMWQVGGSLKVKSATIFPKLAQLWQVARVAGMAGILKNFFDAENNVAPETPIDLSHP